MRRLASEGTRSYLPWAKQVTELHLRPTLTVPIIDALYRDDSTYVRRSVGNHVNDLSRRHPELVVEIGKRWLAAPDRNIKRCQESVPHPYQSRRRGSPRRDGFRWRR